MKTRSTTPLGALHPILFMAGIYVAALLFSIFIFSTLFYSCNAENTKPIGNKAQLHEPAKNNHVAVR